MNSCFNNWRFMTLSPRACGHAGSLGHEIECEFYIPLRLEFKVYIVGFSRSRATPGAADDDQPNKKGARARRRWRDPCDNTPRFRRSRWRRRQSDRRDSRRQTHQPTGRRFRKAPRHTRFAGFSNARSCRQDVSLRSSMRLARDAFPLGGGARRAFDRSRGAGPRGEDNGGRNAARLVHRRMRPKGSPFRRRPPRKSLTSDLRYGILVLKVDCDGCFVPTT
jgi:hypothetical protein